MPIPNACAHRLSRLRNSWFMTFMFMFTWLNPSVLWKIAWCLDWRIELLCWILKSSLMNLVRFHVFIASSMKGFYLLNCLALSSVCLISNIDFCFEWFDLSLHALHYYVDQDYVGSMSPQKLFCFYRLPTRGRVGTKLGDAWYVSNVSIISDVPC